MPETIEEKWIGIETTTPMLLRITYRSKSGIIDANEKIQEDAEIKVFPNPTQDRFRVDCKCSGFVRIYDMAGKEVLYKEINEQAEIAINHLIKGIYNVTVFSKNGTIIGSSKIVKH